MDARDRPSRRHGTSQTPRSKHRMSLSIRTATHTTPPAIQQATPPSQPYPIYPLPIPREKEARAVELYIQYCDAQLKEKVETSQIEPQSAASHRGGYHLTVPGPPTAHSVASFTSSKYSLPVSAYDANTDLSSVLSFEDEDEPTSAAVKNEGELMSFDGKKIKQRRRKRLSPVARAKAALVRHLGSCWVCRSRRVKCPLEHHDVDVLKSLRLKRFEAQRPKADNNSSSSMSSSSQQTATSVRAWPNTGAGFSQSDTLMGIGGIGGDLNATLENVDTSQLDIQSPGGAAYGEISLDVPAPPLRSLGESHMAEFGPNPYSSYQDGQMLVLGARREGIFYCQHLDGLCLDIFGTDEELQIHFQYAHFAFNRITPAHRFVCLSCTHFNDDIVGPCSNCLSVGTIELWIYGNFIRNPTFQRHAPDAQDIANWTPTTFFSSTYPTSNLDQWDQELNSGNFGGYTNTNTDNFDFQGGNFGGSQYDYQPSNHSSYSTNHFQGNMFNNARQLAISHSHFSAQIFYGKVQDPPQHHNSKLLLFLLFLLLAVVVLSFSHDWILARARAALPRLAVEFRAHVQLLGFFGMVGSFGMFFSVKQFAKQRGRRLRCYQYQYQRPRDPRYGFCDEHLPVMCGRTAHAAFVLGGGFA
ncbi:hypothetical protein ACEPPN_006277 [Leptodophora sp. 'Broadleaf-Isolate-01']